MTITRDDIQVANVRGIAPEQYVQEKLDAALNGYAPAELNRIKLAREKLEQQEAEVTAAAIRVATEWKEMIGKRADLKQQVGNCEYFRDQAEQHLADSKHTLGFCILGRHHLPQYNSLPGTMEIAKTIVALEKALELYPAWLEKTQAELTAVESEIKSFVLKHKHFATELPEGLK